MKLYLSLLLISISYFTFSQKKTLDHTVYNDWKSLRGSMVSNDGNFVSYEINPHRGDGYLYLLDITNNELDSFPRGKNAQFSDDSDFFTFKVTAGYDTLRQCELKDVDKKKWPKDSLFVVRLADKDIKSFSMLKSMEVPEHGGWMAYSIDSIYAEPEYNIETKKGFFAWVKKIFKKKKEEPKKEKDSSKGKIVYLFQPSTENRVQFNDVTKFDFSESGEYLLYTQHKKVGKVDKYSLSAFDIANAEIIDIDTARQAIKNFTSSKTDKFLAYLATSDTAEVKNNTFYLYDLKGRKQYTSLDSTNSVVGAGNKISDNQQFIFTKNEKYLFLGVDEVNVKEPEDSLLASEKAKLDVWHYQDKRNQPMQLVQLRRDQRASDCHVLNLSNFQLVPIDNDTLSAYIGNNVLGDYVFASSTEAYSSSYNWNFPFASDHYRISLIDGSTQLLRKEVVMSGELSPMGRYYLYFNDEQEQHYVVDLEKNTGTCITCSIKGVNWQVDGNGTPHVEYPMGIIGWERGEEAVFVQSEFDIWKYDMNDRSMVSITDRMGEEQNIEFRPRSWSYDSVYIAPENTPLIATDLNTKDQMVYEWIDHGDHNDLIKLYQTPHRINNVQKSKDGSQILIRKTNVKDYDLFLTDGNFKNEKRISNTNPQQKDYNWATVELMDYTSRDGQKLQALLYKPENFDANKKYPLLVYFYELYTDRMHSHYAPRPTASIIFPTEYASAGYMVLIPDIRYKPGHPAKSAFNCIMGSTDAALKKYPNIDSTRMGLQGQSWGGYQTAQLITMTDRYAAAMAGAPVSNMFSAYGGIRWGSGMNRQFQYERTQSRIGKTIWEAPALYVENSPLFHLPNVTTPVLIMHNDGDGAVPWYQGIEMFMGLKRLGKPVWMLNYNDDGHNLMKNANRVDLSIRMRQFFDYYLLGAPAPRWLIEGVPAIDKGKDYRLDLMEE